MKSLTLSLLMSYGVPSKARNLKSKHLHIRRNIYVVRGAHHVTRHNTPIHNILSTAPQLNISQKAPGTLPEDGNVMSKRVGATIHN